MADPGLGVPGPTGPRRRRAFTRFCLNVLTFGRFSKRAGVRGRRRRRRGDRAALAPDALQTVPVASLSLAALYAAEEEDSDETATTAACPESSSTRTLRGCFPLTFHPTYLASTSKTASLTSSQSQGVPQPSWATVPGHPQCLLACGSRLWGSGSWLDARSLLGIRVYDFALYVDSRVAAQAGHAIPSHHAVSSHCSHATVPRLPSGLSGTALLDHLLSSQHVPVSVVLRAARDIPLDLLQTEMRAVLERRYQRMGGHTDCPQLKQLVDCFSKHRLPPQLVQGRSGQLHVKEGATMAFSRMPCGRLVAAAFPGDLDIIAQTGQQAAQADDDTSQSGGADTTGSHGHQHHHHHASPWRRVANLWHSAHNKHHHWGQHTQHGANGHSTQQLRLTHDTTAAEQTPSARAWDGSASHTAHTADAAHTAAQLEPPAAAVVPDQAAMTSVVPLVNHPLHENRLSLALLDLYLGSQPVSKKAKSTAVETLTRLTALGPVAEAYRPSQGQVLKTVAATPGADPGDVAPAQVTVVQLQ